MQKQNWNSRLINTLFSQKRTHAQEVDMICVYSLQRVCPQEVLCLCVIHFEDLFQTQACVLDGQTATTSGAEKAAYQGLRSNEANSCASQFSSHQAKTMKSKYMHVKLIFKTCSWIPLLWLLFPSAFKNVFPILLVRSPDF